MDYLAPEIVGHKQYQYQVDNWCVGVLGYELLAGRAPFEGTDDETKSKIANINYKFPDYFSQPARRFIDNVNHSFLNYCHRNLRILALTKRSEKAHVSSRLHCPSMVTKECLQIHVWSIQMSDLRQHG